MKKLSTLLMLLVFLILPALAQMGQYRGRLSPEDQKRFDSYYQRWLDYKRTNNRDQVVSMEERMQDVMRHYNIPASVPYDAIASSAFRGNYRQYRHLLSAEDQERFDSYYQRWQEYRRTNNRDEIISMEKRMEDVMVGYNIPLTVPYRAISTSAADDYHDDADRDGDHWRRRLEPDDQSRFDSYYTRWLEYGRTQDRDQVASMENRMRDLMRQYHIPEDVPFNQVASPDVPQSDYGDLGIISASYGYGDRAADVTGQVRSLLQNGHLSITVNNDSMAGDPAPNHPKKLDLTYSYHGRIRRVTVLEGDTLSLP
jgi:hypothetical protein